MSNQLALQSQIIYQPLLSPVTVVGPHFVLPYSVDVTISKTAIALSAENLEVTDVNGNIMFKVRDKFISLHDRRTLLDAHNIPIISFKRKLISAHRRWQVFRGDSSRWKDLLFTVKQSSVIQFNISIEVFLAANKKEEKCDFKVSGISSERPCTVFAGNANKKEEKCDFKVSGISSERPCTVFAGNSNTIIAQIHKKRAVQNDVVGKESFSVRVFPNVDYVFIVALVMILDEINNGKNDG